ncbi:protein FAM200A-like [Schistocerca serialis cubense]|uniref:protein FAM200A-like n=1 Tax=Schistocerca serialis cubense TaxID=2023355 RepID=UPI00214ECC4B|nr:protein FAM200A-like [Schistocerca serialis cubense]
MAVRSGFFCKYELKSALNTHLFTAICEDLGTEHKRLFHTEVRWLSKENVLVKLFELKVIRFLEILNKTELCMELRKPSVRVVLATVLDCGVDLRGDSNIIYHWDAIAAYTDKLLLWECKIITCFPILFGILEEALFTEVLKKTDTTNKLSNHLQHLTNEFKCYFPSSCDNNIYRLATDIVHIAYTCVQN